MTAQTYQSLVADVLAYHERTDDKFITQLPRFVMLAENRIAAELKLLGFQSVARSNFTHGDSRVPKPDYWRQPISMNYTDATGARREIKLRQYEYARFCFPNPTLVGVPRFYSDYNAAHLLISPTPDQSYPFELLYYARLDPLSERDGTNWLTDTAPQLLFFATMLEASIYLKNSSSAAEFQSHYDRAMAALNGEDKNRSVERPSAVN